MGNIEKTLRRKVKYEDTHKIEDGIERKMCLECDEWKPCTLEFFYSNNSNSKDGLNPYCKSCTVKRSQKRYAAKFDEIQIYKQQWHIENRETVLERASLWAKENREIRNEQLRNFHKQNPDKTREYSQKRTQKNHRISDEEWNCCRQYFNFRCAYCGVTWEEHKRLYKKDLSKEHVDDMGENDLSNCVPACNSCNSEKWIHSLEEWYCEKNPKYTLERLERIYKWLEHDYKKYIENPI